LWRTKIGEGKPRSNQVSKVILKRRKASRGGITPGNGPSSTDAVKRALGGEKVKKKNEKRSNKLGGRIYNKKA